MKLLSSWFFLVGPFPILPRWKLGIMRDFNWRYQRYESCVGWTSWEWGYFRLYRDFIPLVLPE